MVALGMPTEQPVRRFPPVGRELYRELCQDDESNRYTVIVWRHLPGTRTSYTLEDGTQVQSHSSAALRITTTGQIIVPCED